MRGDPLTAQAGPGAPARPRDCDLAISLCAGRRLDLAPLVTARFPLARVGEALRAARDPAQLKGITDVAA